MAGLIQFLPLLFVVLVVVSIARNVLRLTQKLGDASAPSPRTPTADDPALTERTRRIQEEIRRKIAERRGLTIPRAADPAQPVYAPPVIVEEMPAEPAFTQATAAVLERQQQLADQMRALEQARHVDQRRATAADNRREVASQSEAAMLLGARGELLADLKEPGSLRRAIVLREILGAPVGLR